LISTEIACSHDNGCYIFKEQMTILYYVQYCSYLLLSFNKLQTTAILKCRQTKTIYIFCGNQLEQWVAWRKRKSFLKVFLWMKILFFTTTDNCPQ